LEITTENESIVTFTATSPRKSQPRIWKQGPNYVLPIPSEAADKIRDWGPGEDLFVLIGRLSRVRGETLTIRVAGTSVERHKEDKEAGKEG